MSAKPDLETRPHVVYRAYHPNGLLLYVGCTFDFDTRWKSHRAFGKTWQDLTTRVTLQIFWSRSTAIQEESWAIANEKPIFNLMGNGTNFGCSVQPLIIESHHPAYEGRHVA